MKGKPQNKESINVQYVLLQHISGDLMFGAAELMAFCFGLVFVQS